jgi:hypothetical protein
MDQSRLIPACQNSPSVETIERRSQRDLIFPLSKDRMRYQICGGLIDLCSVAAYVDGRRSIQLDEVCQIPNPLEFGRGKVLDTSGRISRPIRSSFKWCVCFCISFVHGVTPSPQLFSEMHQSTITQNILTVLPGESCPDTLWRDLTSLMLLPACCHWLIRPHWNPGSS